MEVRAWSRGLADAVLVAHLLLVLFVVAGLPAIWAGRALRWRWVDTPTFRLIHLATIGVIVAESWLDVTCPLTTWERMLRLRGGDAAYDGSFVGHWLQRLLYWDAPPWVFVVVYTVFGLAVVATWIRLPPRRRSLRPAAPPRSPWTVARHDSALDFVEGETSTDPKGNP